MANELGIGWQLEFSTGAQHRVAPEPPPVFLMNLIGWRRPGERDRCASNTFNAETSFSDRNRDARDWIWSPCRRDVACGVAVPATANGGYC